MAERAALRTPLDDLPAPTLDRYTPAQRAFAVAAWPMRAAEELRSALVYRALARASQRMAVDVRWTSAFESAALDELGHARLCARVGARLGADRPRYDGRPVFARLRTLAAPSMRMASLLLVEVAMGETISMSMFRAGRRAAREPLTRATLERVLADEVRHQRLGWTALAALWPLFCAAERDALQDEATRALGGLELQMAAPALRWLEAGRPFDPAHAELGVLAPEVRVEAFYDAVERLVLPRLHRLGLDGAGAWQSRHARPCTAPPSMR
jgi:hypothetical protein